MLLLKRFTYKLYPTPDQELGLTNQVCNTRFLWNKFVELNNKHYREEKKFLFFYDLVQKLKELKVNHKFLELSFYPSLVLVANRFDRVLRRVIDGKSSFPRYKKKSEKTDTFSFAQDIKLHKAWVFIPKVGRVKWKKHRAMVGKPRSITVICEDGDWYCSVLCYKDVEEKPFELDEKSKIVGCDVGIKSLITLSDGISVDTFDNKKYSNKIEKEKRKLKKKQKGSSNWYKQSKKLHKSFIKIKRARTDFLHKTSSSITKNYDGVIFENLDIVGMMKRRPYMRKQIQNASWRLLRDMFEYKLKDSKKLFLLIDRFEPTSKKCSSCGNIQDMPLKIRSYKCPNCGLVLDRDLNAAINIKNIGLSTFGQSGINACGDLSSKKQEKAIKDQLDDAVLYTDATMTDQIILEILNYENAT